MRYTSIHIFRLFLRILRKALALLRVCLSLVLFLYAFIVSPFVTGFNVFTGLNP